MLWIIAALLMAGLVLGPTFWVRHVMNRHAGERVDFPGTGSEFARHLLDYHGLNDVTVEVTPHGDHYDAKAKAVRLSQKLHDGRSVTAVSVAAHEVGHALQDADGYRPLKWCHRLVMTANLTDRIGTVIIMALSTLGGAAVSPRFFLFGVLAIVLIGLIRVAAHLVTLPVEFDASFGRAMPIMIQGKYLPDEDVPAVRKVLKAAAYTYVAASLLEVLNILRILRVLR